MIRREGRDKANLRLSNGGFETARTKVAAIAVFQVIICAIRKVRRCDEAEEIILRKILVKVGVAVSIPDCEATKQGLTPFFSLII